MTKLRSKVKDVSVYKPSIAFVGIQYSLNLKQQYTLGHFKPSLTPEYAGRAKWKAVLSNVMSLVERSLDVRNFILPAYTGIKEKFKTA